MRKNTVKSLKSNRVKEFMNKGFKILSIEAKDIVSAMELKTCDSVGYNIRDKEGNIRTAKFENTLDWSLDTMKLQEEYYKEIRRKDFYFVVNGKRYTTAVINVKFSYSYKEFNKVGKNIYVKVGNSFKDCIIQDGVCIKDGELIAIQTDVEIQNPIAPEVLGKYFSFTNGCYKQVNQIPTLKNKASIREYLYKNGFVCDGIRYVRYKRSAGSSRVGKCLFVMECLAPRMARWDRCGLAIKAGAPIQLSEYEAYISLPMSSIIDTMIIKPENILLVDDYKSIFKDDVVAVEEVDGRLVATEREETIENAIWDGESLMDVSLFGKYSNKGMLLLRNRFFKTCAFNTNIQQWFEDNGITSVRQLNGYTLATDISQVKLITTPSSVKYLKFGTMEEWLRNIDCTFGIVKYEKKTHFFDGRMVQCHYQLLNTLQLTKEDVQTLLQPSIDYIGAIRSDPAVLRYHIGYAYKEDEDENIKPCKTKNEIVFNLLGINDKFAQTKIYKDFRDAIVKGFYRNLKRGHILLNGNYSTLLGNGFELLQEAIGKFDGKGILDKGEIHSKRFAYDTMVLGTRSPHVTMGNVLLAKNVESALIEKYFNMTEEIVYVNSIGDNLLQRLSGCDFDSDILLLTDNKLLIDRATQNYDTYKVPTNCVSSQKTKRHYTPEDKADLDIKTSINKIGEIVNLSQQLNSLYWERLNGGVSLDENRELYNDICKLDVLSGVEIDKAKKEFTIDSAKEIEILKRKYKLTEGDKTVKPMFFKMITQENGYELSEDVIYRYFETPMDYLQRAIVSANYRQARKCSKETIPFMNIVRKPSTRIKSGYYHQLKDALIEQMREINARIKTTFMDYECKGKDERGEVKRVAKDYKQDCIEVIGHISSHEYLMYIILKELDKKENRSIKTLMFETLFGRLDEAFIAMISQSREPIEVITEDPLGEERLYDFSFKRVLKQAKTAILEEEIA